jgi:hypothetical protein
MTMNNRETIVVAYTCGDSKLWHLRLGHMSEKGTKVLLSKGKLPELKSVGSNSCEGCILGKQKNVSFTKVGRAPKPKILELVHRFVGSHTSGISWRLAVLYHIH